MIYIFNNRIQINHIRSYWIICNQILSYLSLGFRVGVFDGDVGTSEGDKVGSAVGLLVGGPHV